MPNFYIGLNYVTSLYQSIAMIEICHQNYGQKNGKLFRENATIINYPILRQDCFDFEKKEVMRRM